MYLGLVLAGATPQVLAQAAMTRQFNVKDEVEVKDELDKKPNKVTTDPVETASSETDNKITRSVERFLAKFNTADPVTSLCPWSEPGFDSDILQWKTDTGVQSQSFNGHTPIDQILSVTNLPRAGLDSLLAKDAK